jgi:hypothetical protein
MKAALTLKEDAARKILAEADAVRIVSRRAPVAPATQFIFLRFSWRGGLKIRQPQGREGSTPFSGTNPPRQ